MWSSQPYVFGVALGSGLFAGRICHDDESSRAVPNFWIGGLWIRLIVVHSLSPVSSGVRAIRVRSGKQSFHTVSVAAEDSGARVMIAG